MNVKILIDSIVRQTTVLIAQLATSGGVRAPLAHVANQVFLDLSRELYERIELYNAEHGRPAEYDQVVIYGGQHVRAHQEDVGDKR